MCKLTFHVHFSSNRKSAKFDEINVAQTYHPPNKDYGHMKVDEPKTPFNYLDPALAEQDELDASLLTEKLKVAQETARRASLHCEESDEEEKEPETEEQRAKRLEFEKRRKLHYNEASAIKLARKLIEEDIEENLDDDIGESTACGGSESLQDSNDELETEEASSSAAALEQDS
jgi:protein phosphatase inhibitor 2